MFMAVMGVQLLVSTIQTMSAQGQVSGMSNQLQAQNAAMMKSLKELGGLSIARKEPEHRQQMADIELPEFPEEHYNNLQNMQMQNAANRQNAVQKMQDQLQEQKSQFFGENHYETQQGPDGKPRVALDQNGQPVVAKGAETPDQKVTRLAYEADQKAELHEKHEDQRQQFVAQQKEDIQQFVAQNKEQLNNPYVQGELQKMVVDGKKKALQLQQQQEDERWRVDLPPTQEIAATVNGGLQNLRQMDQRHLEMEENSPDAQALIEHDQKVAAIFGEHREKARQEQSDEQFLRDPRKMFATAVASRTAPQDVGQHLPGYLTNALYDLGIYSV